MMIQIHKASYRAEGKEILSDISCEFRAGELYMLVGANGAGKSTLLKMMAGIIPSDAVMLDDAPLSFYSPLERAARIAYLPQKPHVAWELRVAELVALGRLGKAADKGLCADMLAQCGLAGFEKRLYSSLSGGEQARAHLARLLAGKPSVILADEPCAALDPVAARQILGVLQAQAAAGACVVMTLHDMSLLSMLDAPCLALRNGRLWRQCRSAELQKAEILAALYGGDFM